MLKRNPIPTNVLLGVGFDPSFSSITKRISPKWRTVVHDQQGAADAVEELIESARRLVIVAVTPAETDFVMGLADRYPQRIDGVILNVEPEQADHISSWCRDSKFNGLCRFRSDDDEYLARSLGMMLANVEAFSARTVTPGRLVQIR